MIKDTEFSVRKEKYLRISETFRKTYLGQGLTVVQMELLSQLLFFSKQKNKITVLNSHLANFLGVSTKSITRYLKILVSKGLISISYTKISLFGKVKTGRVIKVHLRDNLSHKKLYKHNKAKAEISRIEKPKEEKEIKSRQVEKLTTIFETKSKEMGIHVSREDLQFEARKFDSYFSQKGFKRYTSQDGKRYVYRAVGDWILWDKFGIFHQKIEQKKEFEKSQKRYQEKERLEQTLERDCSIYKKFDEFYSLKTLENYNRYKDMREEEVILEMRQIFREDPYLEGYFRHSEVRV